MLTVSVACLLTGVAIGWAARAARAEADLRRGVVTGPNKFSTRGKTGPDTMDIPAIWR